MSRFTIIEGADATGKTSFANALGARTRRPVLHAGPPTKKTWGEEYIEPLAQAGPMVLDRWHMGEIIWPFIFGRRSLFKCGRDYRVCCQALALLDAEVIILTREPAGIATTLRSRGEESTLEDVLLAQEFFLEFAALTPHLPISIQNYDPRWEGGVPCTPS